MRYIYAGGMHIAKIAGADSSWYHCDALGSPHAMTNELGTTVTWSGTYYPFGEATASGTRTNTHQFTGKELDSEMGLNYVCQRYYDPQIGRFMTLDPFGGYIEIPQSQNRYAYVMSNPLKYIDPLGLQLQTEWWEEYYEEGLTVYEKRPEHPKDEEDIFGGWTASTGMAGGETGIGRPLPPIPPSRDEVILRNLGNPGFENAKYPFAEYPGSDGGSAPNDILSVSLPAMSIPEWMATHYFDPSSLPLFMKANRNSLRLLGDDVGLINMSFLIDILLLKYMAGPTAIRFPHLEKGTGTDMLIHYEQYESRMTRFDIFYPYPHKYPHIHLWTDH